MKSYNMSALKGQPITDGEFQEEMREIGIYIPDQYLYTPALNSFMMDAIHDDTVSKLPNEKNPLTQQLYTPQEAKEEAGALRSKAKENLAALMSAQ
jgi:hypothetical protein